MYTINVAFRFQDMKEIMHKKMTNKYVQADKTPQSFLLNHWGKLFLC